MPTTLDGFTNFETGDFSEAFATSGSVTISTSFPHSGTYSLHSNPVTTGVGACQLGTYDASTGALVALGFAANAPIYLQFYVYPETLASTTSGSEEIFAVTDSLGTVQFSLRWHGEGIIELYNGATLVADSLRSTFVVNTSYRFQVKFQTGTSGAYQVLLNGASLFSGTASFGANPVAAVFLGKRVNNNGYGYSLYYDDVTWSTSGFPNDSAGAILTAIGAGTLQQWSGSYTGVNSVPFSSGSPISTSLSNKKFDVALELALTAGIPAGSTVNGVKVVAIAESSASNDISTLVTIGGNAYGNGGAAMSGSYAAFGQFFATNPNSLAAWTTADLDTTQARIQSNTTGLVQCAGLYLLVDYSVPGPPSPGSQSTVLGFLTFEDGLLLEGASTGGAVSASTSHPHSGTYSLRCNPVTTGLAWFQMGNFGGGYLSGGGVQALTFLTTDTPFFVWSMYAATLPASNDEEIFSVNDSTPALKLGLRVKADGTLSVYNSGGLVSSSSAGAVTAGVAHTIGLQFAASGSAPYAVLVDGTTVTSGTASFGASAIAAVYLGKKVNHNGQGYDVYFDDLAWSVIAMPALGSVAIWLPTSGSSHIISGGGWSGSYTNLTEIPPDGDTSFISASPSGGNAAVQSYPISLSIPGSLAGATIMGIKVLAYARSSSGSPTFQQALDIGTDLWWCSDAIALPGSYVVHGVQATNNPNTNLAWTASDVGGMQPTLSAAVNGTTARDSALYVFGYYAVAPVFASPLPKAIFVPAPPRYRRNPPAAVVVQSAKPPTVSHTAPPKPIVIAVPWKFYQDLYY
jgi:hypothetical protein